jgi:hypothetical protein
MRKSRLLSACFFLLSTVILLSSCEEDMDMRKKKNPKIKIDRKSKQFIELPRVDLNTSVINFDTPTLSAGDILSTVYSADGIGPVLVRGNNPRFGIRKNAAMIFDSNKPTGGDPDLGTPHKDFRGPGKGEGGKYGSSYENKYKLNNVLIISEDLDSSDPDDEGRRAGTQLIFDFTQVRKNYPSIVVKSIDVLDIEENETGEIAFIEFLDENLTVLKKIYFPAVGDNGYARVNLPYVPFVNRIVVQFTGSGAIDNIAFMAKSSACVLSKDYFIAHPEAWGGLNFETPFFLCDHDYYNALAGATNGSGYYMLSQQYITALLNVYNGAQVPAEVMSAIDMAKDLFEYYTPSRIGQLKEGDPLRQMFLNISKVLDDYNNGFAGIPTCTVLAVN